MQTVQLPKWSDGIKEYMRVYRMLHAEKFRLYHKEYRKNNRSRIAGYGVKYRAKYPEARKQTVAKYKKRNKAKITEYNRTYVTKRLKVNPVYKLRFMLCCATRRMVLRGWTKKCRTAELIGCDWTTLKRHIESMFQPGMTWENYGKFGWHIDHIIPISSISAPDDNMVRRVMHYTNLQPLWWRDNISKGNRLPPDVKDEPPLPAA